MPVTPEDQSWYTSVYNQHLEHSRFHENAREAATRIILLISGGLFSIVLVTQNHVAGLQDWHIGIVIAILGIFGFVLSAAHNLKQTEHHYQAITIYNEIMLATEDRKALRTALKQARDDARNNWYGPRPTLKRLWLFINVLVFAAGAATAYLEHPKTILPF